MPPRPEKPLATSVDGRHFVYEVPVAELDLRVGGYVVIDDGRSGGRLGYVTSAALADGDRRHARVEGRVLEGPVAPFGDVPTRDATSDEVARWLEAVRPRRAMLGVGTLALAEGVPLELDAGAFDRTRSSAGSRARARPTRSGRSSNGCWPRRRFGSSCSTRTRTSCASASCGTTRRTTCVPVSRPRRPESTCAARARPATGACTSATGTSTRRSARLSSASTPSPTARSTRRSSRPWRAPTRTCAPRCRRRSTAWRRDRSRSGPRHAHSQPRRRSLAGVVGERLRLARGARPGGRPAVRGRRSRLARDAGRAGRRGRGAPRLPLAAARGPRAAADRDRRGAQRVSRAARGPAHPARDRARRPHRR